ncbi:MAG TPA: adenylate/guanylate cyclase domain-containing protein [Oligoflexus sp.]|uniref:adenylate/guanylate cyclase domain-containing protein n=1 Tax=Oligoflexus sp. TaxID=1971216 RepID=UPI002D49533C|nr:adenylate/guanylate cyclase domain-containing protein [Oligoflexus sp.]HYX32002.1 adenylate/guanylate cyclase domain-containing protein [Oligoflexus sp.]
MTIFRLQNLPHSGRVSFMMAFMAIPGWALAVVAILLFEQIFGYKSELSFFQFALVPGGMTVFGLLVTYFKLYKLLRIPPTQMTLLMTACHGAWAEYVVLQIHESYNGYVILFLFSFGLLFLKVSVGFWHTLLFSIANLGLASFFIYVLDITWGTDEKVFVFFFCFYGFSSALLNEVARRNYFQLKLEQKKTHHSFRQLDKVFYPHQLRMMEQGMELEKTMPCGSGRGCAIFFDIIASSKVEHERAQALFRETFGRCSQLMMDQYNEDRMECNAFRINEMGDGFLCSIGYPFLAPQGRPNAEVALELAYRFVEIFEQNVQTLDYTSPIYCSIGIASGELESFYTTYRPIEYHMYGRAVILATRYEEARKIVVQTIDLKGSMIVLQSQVYRSLPANIRRDFVEFDLNENSFKVRDDPSATKLFYRMFNAAEQGDPVRRDRLVS